MRFGNVLINSPMQDLRQTKQFSRFLQKIGWVYEEKDGVYYAIRKLGFLGSVMKIQRPKMIDFEFIANLQKTYRAFNIIVEPISETYSKELIAHGYKKSKTPFLPSKTIHIDLRKSENQLLRDLNQKTRYNIKIAQKRGVVIKESISIVEFSKAWHDSARHRGMYFSQHKEIVSMWKSFKGKRDLLFAYHNKQLLGGIMIVYSNEVGYYMYAYSSKLGKKLFTPTLLAWHAIQIVKSKDYNVFDFEGIYDERFPLPSWKGFSRFKKGFGGKEVEYPGAWTKWRLPL